MLLKNEKSWRLPINDTYRDKLRLFRLIYPFMIFSQNKLLPTQFSTHHITYIKKWVYHLTNINGRRTADDNWQNAVSKAHLMHLKGGQPKLTCLLFSLLSRIRRDVSEKWSWCCGIAENLSQIYIILCVMCLFLSALFWHEIFVIREQKGFWLDLLLKNMIVQYVYLNRHGKNRLSQPAINCCLSGHTIFY